MHRSSTLTLILTRLHEPPPVDDSVHSPADISMLALLAGRGKLERKWAASNVAEARLESWQRGLIAALGLNENDYPSAPISALSGDSEPLADWLHAEPVHLVAGMNEVALVPLPPAFRLTEEERDALTPALGAHLAIEGFELRTSTSGWLVGAQQSFKVDTVCVDYAKRNEWNAVLPQGEHAGRLRRLMTEMQMLLHEHPVNEHRAARGTPIVNSVWLWGNGRAANQEARATVPSCFGADEYLRGICKVNGWPRPPGRPSAEKLIDQARRSQQVVGVLSDLTFDELESLWLKPIVLALKNGHIELLHIALDEWQLTVDRWQLRKFWRRSLPFAAWMRT